MQKYQIDDDPSMGHRAPTHLRPQLEVNANVQLVIGTSMGGMSA
jgi:homoserine acetyltransferase